MRWHTDQVIKMEYEKQVKLNKILDKADVEVLKAIGENEPQLKELVDKHIESKTESYQQGGYYEGHCPRCGRVSVAYFVTGNVCSVCNQTDKVKIIKTVKK